MFTRKTVENALKTVKLNLARDFKHMTIVFNSYHFNKIIYIK